MKAIYGTIKYLLFRPAYLTKSYLAGKRMTYVPPVKLYIFISFIAFFLPGILPNFNEGHYNITGQKYIKMGDSLSKSGQQKIDIKDTAAITTTRNLDDTSFITVAGDDIKTEAEYDSIQNTLPLTKRNNSIGNWLHKRSIRFNNMPPKERQEKLVEQLTHNFPKVLFFYLPIFAFLLWIFHSKKKWFYFDHAIFTLHFFSFILLVVTIFNLINNLIPWHYFIDSFQVSKVLMVIGCLWTLQYFYRGRRKLYEEKLRVTWIKSTLLLFINTIIFTLILFGFVIFIILNLH